MDNLIKKYNIAEKDLYRIGCIELQKEGSSFLKRENLKAIVLKILKPYNIKFIDLGAVISEIKNGSYDIKLSEVYSASEKSAIELLINDKNSTINFYKDWWSTKTKIQKWGIALLTFFLMGLFGQKQKSTNKSSDSTNLFFNLKSVKPKLCDCKNEYLKDVDEAAIQGETELSDFSIECEKYYTIEKIIYADCGLNNYDPNYKAK